ncbi:VPS16 vacuolar sorting protein [Cryptosporidium ryanae]|uniref:VPS16 vacuolar sorting protein n=1 Tax=Cryptosporidium ryanae TaxID=515981 RepID=UPI00351A749F|nr:VPS16 vacuolar sorting protein [Cryptosporidium ryanae]
MKYNWRKLGDGWYEHRKDSCMGWEVTDKELKRNIIAISNNGGPVAILMTNSGTGNGLVLTFNLIIYTFRGREIARMTWLDHIPVSMDWSSEGTLITVFSDATIKVFSPLLELLQVYSLKKSINSNGCIILSKILSYGICFVSSSYDVHFISSLDYSKSYCLTKIPLRCNPFDISLTIPVRSCDKFFFKFPTNIFLPLEDYSVAVLNIWDPNISTIVKKDGIISPKAVEPAYFTENKSLTLKERFIGFSISPNSEILATLTESFILTMRKTTSIFEEPFFSCKLDIPFVKIRQLVWCGNDSIALNTLVNSNETNLTSAETISDSNITKKQNNVLYIGGFWNQWLTYNYGRHSFILITEVDGLKIQTSSHSEYISKVPKSLENIFGIGSCDPSAMLYFSYDKHISGDITAYHSLRAISSHFLEASLTCIDAAINLYYDEDTYIKLLRVASFGKQFFIKYSSNTTKDIKNWEKKYIMACRDLRIIKAINQSLAEFNTNVVQLRAFGIRVLSSRLANHKCYLLSIKICEYCNISAYHVLSNWACDKIRHSIDYTDEELSNIIVSKISGRRGLDINNNYFSVIANEAAKSGRPHLAILLLEHEPNLQRRIYMLLKLPSFKLAVEQSIKSRNIDLVYVCVVHLLYNSTEIKNIGFDDSNLDITSQKHYWNLEIIETLVKIPDIIPFVIYYCTHLGETELLMKLFEEIKNYFDAGWVKIMLASAEESILIKLEHLAHAAAYFSSSINSNNNIEINKLISNKSFNKYIQLLKKTIPQTTDMRKQSISFIHSLNSNSGSFERETVISEIELLQYQMNLEVKSKKNSWHVSQIPNYSTFIGISLANTIKFLAFLGLLDELNNIKNAINVSESLYLTYKIKGLAAGKKFQELSSEIQNMNLNCLPISLEKIIDICLYYDARHIAAKLIPKLKNSEKQAYWYNRAGMYRETGQIRSNDSSVQSKIMNTFSGAIGKIIRNE